MSKSSGVVTTRIVLAVVLLSLIVACVYYFIIKARNDAADADNSIFATYNSVMDSQNVSSIFARLGGDLESGDYYQYAVKNEILGYKESYLNLYMSKQLLEANSFRLISSHGDTKEIENSLTSVTKSAKDLCHSITVYDTSKEEYGENPDPAHQEAMKKNFNTIVKDLANYSSVFVTLSNKVFVYTAKSYYAGVNAFSSAQYLYSYCLDKQINVLNTAVKGNSQGVDSNIYKESILVAKKFKTVADGNFNVQTTDTTVGDVIDYYVDKKDSFDDLLNAENKSEFIKSIEDQTRYARVSDVMTMIGLQGRIS